MLTVLGNDPTIPPHTAPFHYFRSGLEAYRSLEHVMRCLGRPLGSGRECILEFACGHGRITRFLATTVPHRRHWASDILPDAVDFVRRVFGVRSIRSHAEPARFRPWRRFDVIFVASLFSHLPRHRFDAWLARLYRLLRPCGVLIFTTINAAASPHIAKDPGGFTFVPSSESARLSSSEYGSTFVTEHWMAGAAARCGIGYFRRLANDVWYYQDLYVAARSELPGIAGLANTPKAWGRIDGLAPGESGGKRVMGWAGSLADDDPVVRVFLHTDRGVVPATIGNPRPDVVDFYRRPSLAHSGWQAEVEKDARFAIARATLRSGVSTCFDTATNGS